MTEPAEKKPSGQLSADMLGVGAALDRAADKVWEEARRTGIPVVYMKDGKITRSLERPKAGD